MILKEEWLNYPNLTDSASEEFFTPNVYMNANISGTKSAARLHHRWWFSLMPHVTGYTDRGFSNNWWDYLYLGDYVTSISSETKKFVYNVGDYIDDISVQITYKSGKNEIVKLNEYQKNLKFSNEDIFSIDNDGRIVATKEGSSTLYYYRDGKNIILNIQII